MKKKQLTNEQRRFYVGQRALKQFEEIEMVRPLTVTETIQRDKVRSELYDTVARYGYKEASQQMQRYRLDNDAYKEVYQSLALTFFQQLPYYDPTKSTPTTYFAPYFRQTISEYLRSFSQHLSQYDSHNVASVRAAIHEFESTGRKWTDESISVRTGLSIKVVRQTLQMARNSIRANIDDELNLGSREPTPEEQYLKNERESTIWNAIRRNLSPEDYEFFMYKVNLDERSEHNFSELAKHFKMNADVARERYHAIIATLNNEPDLRQYSRQSSGDDVKVSLHKTPVISEEKMMLDAMNVLSSVNIHIHIDGEIANKEKSSGNVTSSVETRHNQTETDSL